MECDECFSTSSERSLSPSDTELSSPELAVCYDIHVTAKDNDVIEDNDQEISENGQEVLCLVSLPLSLSLVDRSHGSINIFLFSIIKCHTS